jgi:hypothetical protein
MDILVQFPTYGRADRFLDVLDKYVSMSSAENDIYFNINCDSADLTMTGNNIQQSIVEIMEQRLNVCYSINYDSNTEKISAINANIANLDFSWDIVICASDDMVPRVDGWDLEISDAMQEHYPNLDGCVHFNDGNTNGNLITFSILGRELYESFGYIYHPDYKSLYCDDEFTQVVRKMGKETYIDKIIVSHEHYSIKGSQNHGIRDMATVKTLAFSGRDQQVFAMRQGLGFPKERITKD